MIRTLFKAMFNCIAFVLIGLCLIGIGLIDQTFWSILR